MAFSGSGMASGRFGYIPARPGVASAFQLVGAAPIGHSFQARSFLQPIALNPIRPIPIAKWIKLDSTNATS